MLALWLVLLNSIHKHCTCTHTHTHTSEDYNSRPSAICHARRLNGHPLKAPDWHCGRSTACILAHTCTCAPHPLAYSQGHGGGKKPKKRATPACTMSASKKQKHQVTIATFKKWQTQLKREHQTLSWLHCDINTVNKELMDVLWCDACRKHERSVTGRKNFLRAWLESLSNHKTSKIVDHANSDQHWAAMIRVHAKAAKATSQPVTSYSR